MNDNLVEVELFSIAIDCDKCALLFDGFGCISEICPNFVRILSEFCPTIGFGMISKFSMSTDFLGLRKLISDTFDTIFCGLKSDMLSEHTICRKMKEIQWNGNILLRNIDEVSFYDDDKTLFNIRRRILHPPYPVIHCGRILHTSTASSHAFDIFLWIEAGSQAAKKSKSSSQQQQQVRAYIDNTFSNSYSRFTTLDYGMRARAHTQPHNHTTSIEHTPTKIMFDGSQTSEILCKHTQNIHNIQMLLWQLAPPNIYLVLLL